jgi:hypothetical protein
MDDLVKELKSIVNKNDARDDYIFMNSNYVPVKIEQKNFHGISDIKDSMDNNMVSEKNSKKVLFVDGGNSVLFESAAFCVSFVRVGGITYSNNKRLKRQLKEFYMFVNERDGKYYVRTYPETSFNSMIFDPRDESLRNGLEKCTVVRIVSVVRRFAEIEFAYETLQGKDIDYVVMDGTLEARYPYEDIYLNRLFSFGKTCALSKTCTLTTKNGLGVTKKLLDLPMTHGAWYYYPIVINNNPKHDAEMYFIKLNAKTHYVFRFEIQKGFSGYDSELFSTLSSNSSDPVFLGYPYGLIDIDQYVRISDDETRILQTKLSTKLGKDWNEFSKYLNSMNAHSILDKIKF